MKNVVCIFAHPDDEAFGPGGTVAAYAQKHNVYIICVTNGDAGKNSTSSTDERELGEIRRGELECSAQTLGVKQVYFLGYKDGTLSNSIYHEIAGKIKDILDDLKPETLFTYEPRGISGHIDHIAVSMITSFLFDKLPYAETLFYYCLSKKARETQGNDYFIHFPPGYNKEDIGMIVDTSSVWDIKIKAMHCHQSQKHDIERVLSRQLQLPREEYFLVKKK